MKFFLLSFAAVCLASCGTTMPKAQSSKHLKVVQAGLSIKHFKAAKPYTYKATFKLREGSPAPAYLKANFGKLSGDPSFGPFANARIAQAGTVVTVETEPFKFLPKEGWTWVTAELYSDAAMRNKIDEVVQQFRVIVPSPETMRKQGLGHLVD